MVLFREPLLTVTDCSIGAGSRRVIRFILVAGLSLILYLVVGHVSSIAAWDTDRPTQTAQKNVYLSRWPPLT